MSSRAPLLLLLALGVSGCARHEPAPVPVTEDASPVPTTTIDAVAQRLGQAQFFLYDANPRDMYDRGHIRGAQWVKFNAVTRDLLPADQSAQLVFYCANEMCSASHDAARSALALGFTHVEVMPAGYFGWKRAGHPVDEPAQ